MKEENELKKMCLEDTLKKFENRKTVYGELLASVNDKEIESKGEDRAFGDLYVSFFRYHKFNGDPIVREKDDMLRLSSRKSPRFFGLPVDNGYEINDVLCRATVFSESCIRAVSREHRSHEGVESSDPISEYKSSSKFDRDCDVMTEMMGILHDEVKGVYLFEEHTEGKDLTPLKKQVFKDILDVRPLLKDLIQTYQSAAGVVRDYMAGDLDNVQRYDNIERTHF
jgi:hypothetical protein